MSEPGTLAGDVRGRTSALIRERREALAADVASAISCTGAVREPEQWHGLAELLLRLFATSIDVGELDPQSVAMRDLARYSPPLTTHQLLDALHITERMLLDEIALDDR